MGIDWTPRLAVGVESIDAQHRELFTRVNQLLAAMEAQQSESEVKRLVAFLGDYVVSHFGAEERLMQQQGYPDFPAHQKIHAEFVNDLGRLRDQLARHGTSASLAIQLNRRICDWLLDHVGRTDRALGQFLAKKAATAPRP